MNPGLKEAVQTSLADRYRLGDVVYEDSAHAVFEAVGVSPDVRPQVGIVLEISASAAAHFNRYLEAGFLHHPQLVEVLHAGWVESAGHRYPYLITEQPNEFLATVLDQRAPSYQQLVDLGEQLAAGLAYIHSENLVHCALTETAIWCVDGKWKLADFSQLRVPGVEPAESLRGLLISRSLAAPPEAFHGEVGPAWDVWSLGNLLGRIMQPAPRKNGSEAAERSPVQASHEFQELIADMSAPDASSRPSIEQVRASLAGMERHAPPTPDRDVFTETEESFSHEYSPLAVGEPRTLAPRPFSRELPRVEQPRSRTRAIQVAIFAAAILVISFLFATKSRVTSAANSVVPASAPVSESLGSAQPPQAIDAKVRAGSAPLVTVPAESLDVRKAQIASVLNRWAFAARERSAEDQARCYGPVVDTYFGRHHVTGPELLNEKSRVFSEIGPVERFEVGSIRYDKLSDNWAVVSFDKTWAFAGRKPFSGSARVQVVMRSFGGDWRITSERELKVYSMRMAG